MRPWILLTLTALTFSTSASANEQIDSPLGSVLDTWGHRAFCGPAPEENGTENFVDPDRLAERVIGEFGIPKELLRTASSTGIENAKAGRRELAYAFAVLGNDQILGARCSMSAEAGIDAVKSCSAFGPANTPGWAKKDPDLFLLGMTNLTRAATQLNVNLNTEAPIGAGKDKYVVLDPDNGPRRVAKLFAATDRNGFPTGSLDSPSMPIQCRYAERAVEETPKNNDDRENMVLVGLKPEDLTKFDGNKKRTIKKVVPATFNLEGDRRTNSTAFSINGTIGTFVTDWEFGQARIEDDAGQSSGSTHGLFNILAYTTYKLTAVDGPGADERIHKAEPGIIASGIMQFDNIASTNDALNIATAANLSTTFDLENGSKVVNLQTSFVPALRLGSFRFPPDSQKILGLTLIPEAALLAETRYVTSAAGNARLKNGAQYAVGGALGLDVLFPGDSFLSDSSISIDYKYLEIASGAIDNAERFTATTTLALFDDDHIALSLSYVDGRDMSTYQKEQTWKAGFGIRY